MSPAIIAIIIIVVAMVLFATEVIPLPVTALLAAVSMAVFGVLDFKGAFAGFGNDNLFLVAGMLIVGRTAFETGLVNKLGVFLRKIVSKGERASMVSFQTATGLFSGFISDTTMTALMLPIAEATAKSAKKPHLKTLLFMPIGAAAGLGGSLTLVGSVPQVMVNGYLTDAGLESMGFFTIAKVGLPLLVIGIIYYSTVGYHLLKKVTPPIEQQDAATQDEAPVATQPEQSTYKMVITAAVFVFCVVGFISGLWTLGTVSIVSALVLIVTRCISLHNVAHNIDWGPVVILGGSLGFSSGLAASGGGELIANTLIDLCGGEAANPLFIFGIILVISAVMTNVMANTACTAMMAPIAIFLAQSMGVNPMTMALGVVYMAVTAIATPIATVPMTLTLPGGYRFMDYVKVGGPMTAIAVVVALVLAPIAYGF